MKTRNVTMPAGMMAIGVVLGHASFDHGPAL